MASPIARSDYLYLLDDGRVYDARREAFLPRPPGGLKLEPRSIIRFGIWEDYTGSLPVKKHMGPGPHPSGTSQDEHGKRSIGAVVGRGKPHRWKTESSFDSKRSYWEQGQLSRDTVRRRIDFLTNLVTESGYGSGSLPEGLKVEYWLDWEEYRNAVKPGKDSWPLARWEPSENRIVISPSLAPNLFYDGDMGGYRVLTHELMHSTSPIGNEGGLSGPARVLEEGMAELSSLKLWADYVELDEFGGLPKLVDNVAYPEFTTNLLLQAGTEEGWDRQRIWTNLQEKWRANEYHIDYQRYEPYTLPSVEEELSAKLSEIDAQYDSMVAKLPQHEAEYRRNQEQLKNDIRQSGIPNFRREANTHFETAVASAQSAGINLDRYPSLIADDIWEIEAMERKASGDTKTKADVERLENVSKSLLYWFLGGE